jgi:flagellar protein FlaJ
MRNVQLIVRKVLELLSEIETYSFYKDALVKSLEKLFNDYQAGKFTYFEYENAQKKLLKDKTKDEWINYYNSYILSLLKRVETYNSQIFYETYTNRDYERIGRPKPKPVPVKRPAPKVVKVPEPELEEPPAPAPKVRHEKPAVPPHVEAVPEKPAVEAKPAPEPALVEVKPSLMDKIALFFKHLFAKKEVDKEIEELRKPAKKPVPAPEKPVAEEHLKKLKPAAKPKRHWWDFLFGKPAPKPSVLEAAKPKPAKPSKVGLAFSHFFGIDALRKILARSRNVEFTDVKSKIPTSTIQLETLRRKAKPEISTQIEKITATSLTKEAKRIKNIMEKRKALKIYQPSFFGAVANVVIKRISLFLLDQFPDFFKDLYHALRLANIKVLSNTYVNMMVLGVIASTLVGLFIFGLFFSVTALPITQIIFRTLMMSALLGLAAFAGFYAYPYSMVKNRRRSINTNLPFAINHMAAVSSSGVAPVRMFKLISESKEYGEVSVEIEKIVNYIEVFGYDVLTALKAVASTTPSYHFKDFLEGMVSTTQTGGDLKSYFAQKADEAMLNYKLERQKYTETISTYSDIYTGILIAAPLFFVAALSLVSLLGGKVGGMNVNVVIVMGTYVIIPFMNVAFLTFLTITQPEI